VATLGEWHFCDGIGGYFGRRSFLWRDWWLSWEKGLFVAGLVATLGEGHFCGGIALQTLFDL
jgi:hypothetical protein